MSRSGSFPAGIARRDHDGSGQSILCVHATGFCKETWDPVVAELRAAGVPNPVVAVDQRGHGDSTRPGEPFDWWDLGRDAREVAVAVGAPVALGIGHSSGGAALIMAELLAPGSFAALLLVEPIVFPGPYGVHEPHPLSDGALRRRAAFASPDEALANFRGKGPFAGWEDRALEAYVAGCLGRDGDRWALKCRPEVEAEFYRQATVHAAWERLGEVRVPAVVLAGEGSDTHPEDFARLQAAHLGDATAQVVPGATHFVPMERPAAVAAAAAALLARGQR